MMLLITREGHFLPADLFTILPPQDDPLPVVANLPHSGLQVPAHIAEKFTPEHLQSLPNSDWHLQKLYDFLPSLGITVMQANYSRYVVDLNRALKTPLFGSFWSAVVPEQTAFKQPIYRQDPTSKQPTRAEVRSRIDEYYTPYHQKLTDLLNEKIASFGYVYLLDLHSFMGLITDDVCLGNADGKTCEAVFIEQVNNSFAEQGYQVVNNKVFTGGHITRHYGSQNGSHYGSQTGAQQQKGLATRCQRGPVEALQIEVRYPTYLPEDQLDVPQIPTWEGPRFTQAQQRLNRVFTSICTAVR